MKMNTLSKVILFIIISILSLNPIKACDLHCGNVFVDGSLITKTVCYDAESGPINATGWSVSNGTGQICSSPVNDVDEWQISYDGGNFQTFQMPAGGIIKNCISTFWIRKHIKCHGSYYTALAWGFGYSKEGTTNAIQIIVRPKTDAGNISGAQTICYNGTPNILVNAVSPSGADGVFSYQWQSSLDATPDGSSGTWSQIPSSNSLTFQPTALTQSTFFRRLSTSTCGTIYTSPVYVGVYQNLSVNNITGAQTICYNSKPAAIYSNGIGGGNGNYTYQWQSSTDNATWSNVPSANSQVYLPPVLTQTTYYRLWVYCFCGSVYSNSICVTVNNQLFAGLIGSDQKLAYNSIPATLSGTSPTGGTGTYTYQWEKSLDNSTWVGIPNATGSSYQPPALIQTIYYRLAVSSGSCGTAWSNSVCMSIYGQLTAGTLSNNQTVCYNAVPDMLTSTSPTGGNGAYTYQWQSSTNSTYWSDIPLATTLVYGPPAVTLSTYYRLIVSSPGYGTVNSNPVLISVLNQLHAGSISNNQTICYNSIPVPLISVLPTGGSGTYTYQWQTSINNATWSTVPGATNSGYSPPALTQTTYYRLAVTSGNCGSDISNVVTLTVNPILTSGSISANQTIFYNTVPAPLQEVNAATGGVGAFSYQWQNSTDNVNWSGIPNSNSTSYSPPVLTQTTYFRRAVSNNCGTVYSNNVTIVVYSDLNAALINANQTICYNTVPAALTGDLPTGGSGTYSYQWQYSIDDVNWYSVTSGSGQNYAPGALLRTTYYRRTVTALPSPTVKYSNEIVITVIPQLADGIIGNNQTICYNSSPITLAGSIPTGGTGFYTYQWYTSPDQVNWTAIAMATNTIYSPSALIKTTYYRRTVSSGNCGTVNSNVVTITVLPSLVPGAIASSQNIFYNTVPTTLLSEAPIGGSGSYSYEWQQSSNSVQFTDIPLTNSVSYSPPVLTQTTYYRLAVTSTGCGTAYSSVVPITVYPPLVAGKISNNQTLCYNSTASLTGDPASGGNGTYSYQWQYSTDGSTWIPGTLGTSQNYITSALSKSCYFRRAVTTGTDSRVVYSNQIVITVLPQITAGTLYNSQNVCYNTTPTTLYGDDPSGGTGAYTYTWYNSPDSLSWVPISNTNNIFSAPPLTQTTYYKRLVTSGSCGSVYSNAVKLKVLNSLSPGTISAGQTICYNTTPTNLVATSATGATNSYTYQWQFADGNNGWTNIANATQNQYQPNNLKQTTYYRMFVTSGGCGSLATNPITINVYNEFSSGSISNNQTICYNSIPLNKFISTPATGGTGTYTYQWQQSDNGKSWNNILLATNANYEENKHLANSVYYQLITSNACGFVTSNMIKINVLSEMESPFVQINNPYCKGSVVPLTITNRDSTLDYIWNIGGQDDDYNDYLTILSLDKSITFDVRSSFQSICESAKSRFTVKLDSIVANFKTDITKIKVGTPIQFNNLSLGGATYQWDFGDGYSTDKNPWYYFYHPGQKTISLIAISQKDCADTMMKENYILVQSPTDINAITSSEFKLYPNPVKDILTIERSNVDQYTYYEITELNGIVLNSGNIMSNEYKIDFSKYAPGTYIIRIYNTSKILTFKLIKL